MFKLKSFQFILFKTLFLIGQTAWALSFPLEAQQDIVGNIRYVRVHKGQSLGDIGKHYDIGVYEMIEANPNIDPWVPEPGTEVIVPSQFILPPGPRQGMVLNLAEMRLYYYHPNKKMVSTYPVGIGRKSWPTPLGNTTIVYKQKDPTWYPPPSIRAEHAGKGDILPAFIRPGPDNPLGQYALRTGFNSILIHGTNKPGGIGLRGSHGCIRMHGADIKELFYLTSVGTPIRIVHEPLKVGQLNGEWYLESHEPLSETRFNHSVSDATLAKLIHHSLPNASALDWILVTSIFKQTNGYPQKLH
ncbi:MAG: L,D-transpeptidase family protein [Gammaproteobacteria bacterium]